jgi:membrane-associated phospholipid phosphatase
VHRKLGLPPLFVTAFAASVAAFALLAHAYSSGSETVEVDAQLAEGLHANVFPSATTFFSAVTMLGSTPVLALVAAVAGAYLIHRGRRRDAALLVVSLVGSLLLTWVLKASFERPRPSFDDPVATASWFSFPSGHALSSIALYGALAHVFANGLRREPVRAAALGAVALLVAAIGFSRMYLGVHYLTDVLAGYSAGIAWLLLVVGMVNTVWRRT